jgi:hypothetical protein
MITMAFASAAPLDTYMKPHCLLPMLERHAKAKYGPEKSLILLSPCCAFPPKPR